MTEIERIKQEKWLPEDFWKAETICDYYVSEEMKKVWAILLDLYKEFARVCEKYGLQYWTDGGTTLGAVRHKGFIPWDDDLDVIMPRKDYEKFIQVIGEFNNPYFVNIPNKNSEYSYSFLKLCNVNTTHIVPAFSCCKYQHSIHIDIFPLDKVTLDDYIPRRERIHNLIMKSSAYMRKDYKSKTLKDIDYINNYYDTSKSTIDIWNEINNIATEDEGRETEYYSLIVSTQYNPKQKIWHKRIFNGYTEIDFETIKVRVPIGYDEQLKIYFGDYMSFPPKDKRGTWHNMTIRFPEVPFDDIKDKIKDIFIEQNIIFSDRNFNPQILEDYLQQHSNDFTPTIKSSLKKLNITMQELSNKLANFGTIVYAKSDDNQIKGMVIGYLHDIPDDGGSYITFVHVDEKFRRQHIAHSLIKQYVEYAKLLGLRYIWLTTGKHNIRAQKLYEELGFEKSENQISNKIKYTYKLKGIDISNQSKVKVITFGVFDYFHYGHYRLLKNAKSLGDYLVVAIQDEQFIKKTKPNANILYSTQQRKELIYELKSVDEVIVYTDVDKTITEIDFDIFAIGEDQTHKGFQKAIQWCESHNKKVVRMQRTKNISSTSIKKSAFGEKERVKYNISDGIVCRGGGVQSNSIFYTQKIYRTKNSVIKAKAA